MCEEKFKSHYSKISIIRTVKGSRVNNRRLSHREWSRGRITPINDAEKETLIYWRFHLFLFRLKTIHIYLFFPLCFIQPKANILSLWEESVHTIIIIPEGAQPLSFVPAVELQPSLCLLPKWMLLKREKEESGMGNGEWEIVVSGNT